MSTPEPLTRDEIAFRQRHAEDMLASWQAEKAAGRRSDEKVVAIDRYEGELRYLATIADLQARALDEEDIKSLARAVDSVTLDMWSEMTLEDVERFIRDEIARRKGAV